MLEVINKNNKNNKNIVNRLKVLTFVCCNLVVLLFSHLTHAFTPTASETSHLKFQKLSIEHGLSQSYVFKTVQDLDGFIWLATQDGLERYDGTQFKHYRHNSADPHSIADNFIRTLYIDSSNTLWIGTNNGLSRYNKDRDNFDNFYHQANKKNSLADNQIWALYEDKGKANHYAERALWIATQKGLHKLDRDEQLIKRIRIRGLEKKLQEVKTIYQDNKRRYWFGTFANGTYLANESLSNVIALHNQVINAPKIESNALFDIQEINNELWLATDQGLYILDDKDNIKQHLTHQSTNGALLADQIRAIAPYQKNSVWLGTKQGLNIINLESGEINQHQKNSNFSSLSENWIMDIFQDNAQRMWLGTFGRGVNIFSPVSNNFHHHLNDQTIEVSAMAQTTDGKIWLSSPQLGLSYFQGQQASSSKTANTYQQINLPVEHISSMFADNSNNLWLLSVTNQLYHFDTTSQLLTENKHWQNSKFAVNSALELIHQQFWYIDNTGTLSAFDLKSGEVDNYPAIDAAYFTGLGHEDSHEPKIWLTTATGKLISFDINLEEFTHHDIAASSAIAQFPLDKTRRIYSDGQWLWLTSTSAGVALYNQKNQQVTVFNESTSLPNNYVSSLLIDQQSNAWLATNKGISVVMPHTKQVKNFASDFLLTHNEFTDNVSLKSTNKHFYFGGINGYYQFTPDEVLSISQTVPTPVLTALFVANDKVEVRNAKQSNNLFTLEKQLSQLKQITLSHTQSPFSISFTSPNAKFQKQINYRYRLLGLEKEWIEAGNRVKQATYTNLSSGHYTFELEAYDLHRPNVSKRRSLAIHILPPWWLNQSALTFYVIIALILLAYIFQQVRHKRLYHMQIKLSEERLKLSLWGSGDEMWDWNITTGKVYRSNIWGILEFPQDGRRNVGADQTNVHPHDIPRIREALDQHFNKQTEHFESTYRVRNKDNNWIWVLDRGKIVERSESGEPTRMTGTLKDISQIKQTAERLKLFAKCIENISDAVVIYDRQFNIVDVNKAFCRITHKSKKQMLGTSLRFNQYPNKFTLAVKKHLITKGGWHGEIESVRDNGEKYLTNLNIDVIKDESNNISHFVGVFSDITKRKETEAELRKLANTDTLTLLPNRSYFQANLTRLVTNKTPHALLVFDLDNFKKVNDSLGHEVGDVLLCKVAERLLNVGRVKDTVYRLGGDEFSIIIEETNDIHTITTIAKDILRTIAEPLKLRNQEIVLYSSIGIVLYPEDGASPQELLKNADTAMYHAKDSGGNKYQYFSESMNKKAVKRLQIENLIRHGLKDDYFSVFFQPKIEISTGKVSGMEALVRFETPSKGVISPLVFIPVSEETGQIIDIGEIVLRKSCFATKRWVDAGLFEGRIAVNLSAVQFTQPNLVAVIAKALKESGLPAKYLELEITEGTVMDSPQKAIETMLQIRSMGVHLSLDDFGTGYSSLAYLKKFPLNTLKIDKAFVDDIESSEQGRNMVATIVTIAHNLGLDVVAEGVETNNQLNFLAGLGCEQLQGYLYSKPLPETDFEKYLLSHQVMSQSTSFSKT